MISLRLQRTTIYDYLFGLLLLMLPFSNAIPNILMILIIVFVISDFKIKTIKKTIKSPFFILILMVFYLFTKAVIYGNFMLELDYYKKYFYLIILPFLVFNVNNIEILKKAALIIINVTILVSFYKISRFYLTFGYFPFNVGWGTNYVLVLERPYAGIFSVLSLILSFEQIQKKTKGTNFYVLSFILSLFFIFFIAIRVSIITFLFLFGIYIFMYLKKSFKSKVLLLIGLISIIVGGVFLNKNISKRFFINTSIEKTFQNIKESEPRIIIYSCIEKIVNQSNFSKLFGFTSYREIEERLLDCYKSSIDNYSRRDWFVGKKHNSHSQFFDIYLIGGIIAIFLFIGFFIFSFIRFHSNFYAMSILISFICMLLIENVFHRQFGCYIFIIFIGMFLNNGKNFSTNNREVLTKLV